MQADVTGTIACCIYMFGAWHLSLSLVQTVDNQCQCTYIVHGESHWLVVKTLLQAQLALRVQHNQSVLPQQNNV